MSSIAKQLVMNNIKLPVELIRIVKDYTFHKIKKIPKNDERYQILLTIPYKEYDYIDNDDVVFVYLRITAEKEYYMVKTKFEIQLQTLGYRDDNVVYFIDGSIHAIE